MYRRGVTSSPRLGGLAPGGFAALLLAALSGCVLEPPAHGTAFPCASDGECAPGHRCVDEACVKATAADDGGPIADVPFLDDAGEPDGGARVDAGLADAGLADAGLIDAGLVDAGPYDAGALDAGFDAGPVDAGPPRVVALHPELANPGAALWIEGRLGAEVTVRFPTGLDVAASVAGSARAFVSVPDGAGSGGVTVLLDGVEVKGPLFTHPGYAIGLSSLRPDDEQAITVRILPRLGEPRADLAAVVVGERVYALGGRTAAGPSALVERARVHGDGALGPFVDAGLSLSEPRRAPAFARAGEWLYVVGGEGGGGPLSSVERASVVQGELSAFEALPVSLERPRAAAAAVVLGTWLYVIGGEDESGARSSVERARIAADGSLGPFAVVGAALVHARAGHQAAVAGERLYVLGGRTGGAASSSVEVAAVSGAGDLGAFVEVDEPLLAPAQAFAALPVDDELYVLGEDSVEGAAAGAGGLGAFSPVGRRGGVGRRGHGAVVVRDWLYVLGGEDGLGLVDLVERASLRDGGAVPGAFADVGVSLPQGHVYGGVAVVGDWVYVLGGNRSGAGVIADIARARVQPDGSLGVFSSAGSLPSPRGYHCAAVLGDWLYLVGGSTTGLAAARDVLRAPIEPDGDLGAFVDTGIDLVTGRHAPVCAAVGGRLYVIGGSNQASLESAPVAPDGTLGAFVTEATSLALGRGFAASAVVDSRLFVVGGLSGSTSVDDVEWADLEADGSLGAFSAAPLAEPWCCGAAAVLGEQLYLVGGRTTDSAHVPGALRADTAAAVPSFESGGLELVSPRRGNRAVVLGDRIHLIGGWNTSDALTVESARLP